MQNEETEFPDSPNVAGVIFSLLTKEEIAKRFENLGWTIRKCTWVDYEIENEYSDLVIEGEEEILIHGLIVTRHFQTLVEKMKELGLKFSLELYDEHVMIDEVKYPE